MVGQHPKTAEGHCAVRSQTAESVAGAPPVAGQGGRGSGPAWPGRHQRRDADQPARRAQSGIPKARGHLQGGLAEARGAQFVG